MKTILQAKNELIMLNDFYKMGFYTKEEYENIRLSIIMSINNNRINTSKEW